MIKGYKWEGILFKCFQDDTFQYRYRYDDEIEDWISLKNPYPLEEYIRKHRIIRSEIELNEIDMILHGFYD